MAYDVISLIDERMNTMMSVVGTATEGVYEYLAELRDIQDSLKHIDINTDVVFAGAKKRGSLAVIPGLPPGEIPVGSGNEKFFLGDPRNLILEGQNGTGDNNLNKLLNKLNNIDGIVRLDEIKHFPKVDEPDYIKIDDYTEVIRKYTEVFYPGKEPEDEEEKKKTPEDNKPESDTPLGKILEGEIPEDGIPLDWLSGIDIDSLTDEDKEKIKMKIMLNGLALRPLISYPDEPELPEEWTPPSPPPYSDVGSYIYHKFSQIALPQALAINISHTAEQLEVIFHEFDEFLPETKYIFDDIEQIYDFLDQNVDILRTLDNEFQNYFDSSIADIQSMTGGSLDIMKQDEIPIMSKDYQHIGASKAKYLYEDILLEEFENYTTKGFEFVDDAKRDNILLGAEAFYAILQTKLKLYEMQINTISSIYRIADRLFAITLARMQLEIEKKKLQLAIQEHLYKTASDYYEAYLEGVETASTQIKIGEAVTESDNAALVNIDVEIEKYKAKIEEYKARLSTAEAELSAWAEKVQIFLEGIKQNTNINDINEALLELNKVSADKMDTLAEQKLMQVDWEAFLVDTKHLKDKVETTMYKADLLVDSVNRMLKEKALGLKIDTQTQDIHRYNAEKIYNRLKLLEDKYDSIISSIKSKYVDELNIRGLSLASDVMRRNLQTFKAVATSISDVANTSYQPLGNIASSLAYALDAVIGGIYEGVENLIQSV